MALKLCVLESSPRNNLEVDIMGRIIAAGCGLGKRAVPLVVGQFESKLVLVEDNQSMYQAYHLRMRLK